MTPSLLEAAKRAVSHLRARGCVDECPGVTSLEAAIAAEEARLKAEEAEPKVERVVLGHVPSVGECRAKWDDARPWDLVWERPIPVVPPKTWAEEVADELLKSPHYSRHADPECDRCKVVIEAAKLLRGERT